MKKKKHKWRIDAGSLAQRSRVRHKLCPPSFEFKDKKNDYSRKNKKDDHDIDP
jgi:hypothetical protein